MRVHEQIGDIEKIHDCPGEVDSRDKIDVRRELLEQDSRFCSTGPADRVGIIRYLCPHIAVIRDIGGEAFELVAREHLVADPESEIGGKSPCDTDPALAIPAGRKSDV